MLSIFYNYQSVSNKMTKVFFLRKNLHFSW